VADIAVVMAKTDPDAPRHKQFSTFIVELPNPGYQIVRDIPTMAVESPLGHVLGGGHSEIKIQDLVIPNENLLGGQGEGFNMGQHRLAYGRLRHGMHNVAMAQRALDMATQHVIERSTFGQPLSQRQGVQWMLADCASELYIARLMLMHIAYKAEKGMDLRQENGIAKVFLANMVHKVVDTAIQLHGALGYSLDTPLARWYTSIRSQRLVDGPTKCIAGTTGRNVIKAVPAARHDGIGLRRGPALGPAAGYGGERRNCDPATSSTISAAEVPQPNHTERMFPPSIWSARPRPSKAPPGRLRTMT